MQRACRTNTTPIHFQSQAARVMPGHGTGAMEAAINDDEYLAEASPLRMALAIAGNVIGGSLLLATVLAIQYRVFCKLINGSTWP